MQERAVGERFVVDRAILEVVEAHKCEDCYFKKDYDLGCNAGIALQAGLCSRYTRSDRIDVSFKFIKKQEDKPCEKEK